MSATTLTLEEAKAASDGVVDRAAVCDRGDAVALDAADQAADDFGRVGVGSVVDRVDLDGDEVLGRHARKLFPRVAAVGGAQDAPVVTDHHRVVSVVVALGHLVDLWGAVRPFH